MRIAMGFLLVCAASCAARNEPPLAAPASLAVDPVAEIIAIPPGYCPGLDDHYALSTAAVRQLIMNERASQAQHAIDLAGCQGAAKLAEARQKNAEEALAVAGWWQRYGPILATSGVVLGLVVGGVGGVIIGGKR